MLERANIPYIAFERRLDRIAEAKKEKRKCTLATLPARHDECVRHLTGPRCDCDNERLFRSQTIDQHRAPFPSNLKVMTTVPYLFQRDELREIGAAQVVALMPEGTLSFGARSWASLALNLIVLNPS